MFAIILIQTFVRVNPIKRDGKGKSSGYFRYCLRQFLCTRNFSFYFLSGRSDLCHHKDIINCLHCGLKITVFNANDDI